MGILAYIGAAAAGYFLATQFIDRGEGLILIGALLLLGVHFAISGMADLWTEIESARMENDE